MQPYGRSISLDTKEEGILLEKSGNMQLEMNAKVAAIRRDLNAFLNCCIDTFDRAVKETDASRAEFESLYQEALEKAAGKGVWCRPLLYVVYLFLGIFGISYAGIDPVFVSFKTYRQFCEHMDNHNPYVEKVNEIHKVTTETAQKGYVLLQAFLAGLADLKAMLNTSVENTLLCYQCFISSSNIPLKRKHEDCMMLLSVFRGCGISIAVSEQRLYDDNLYTTKFQVSDFVRKLKANYAKDAEVQKLLMSLAAEDR